MVRNDEKQKPSEPALFAYLGTLAPRDKHDNRVDDDSSLQSSRYPIFINGNKTKLTTGTFRRLSAGSTRSFVYSQKTIAVYLPNQIGTLGTFDNQYGDLIAFFGKLFEAQISSRENEIKHSN